MNRSLGNAKLIDRTTSYPNISIKKNIQPKMKVCKMKCDSGLDEKLNMYQLTQMMNSHETNLFLGAPKSGKTSLLYAFFQNPKLFKKVFNTIYIFQPSQSRQSMSDQLFNQLPEDQIFETLTYENLESVLERIKDAPEDENSCIVFDDMTAYLKKNNTRKLFEELVYNRRHLHCSIFFLVQTWKSIHLDLRKMFSNIFLFKVAKKELYSIWDEVIEEDQELLPKVSKLVFDKKYNFLFVNVPEKRMFKNWDEIIIGDNDIC
jgi:Poxvirus A32 protein